MEKVKHLPGCLIYVGCHCFEHVCEPGVVPCQECEWKAEQTLIQNQTDEKELSV